MPHSGSAASGNTQISHQSGIPFASAIENAEEETSAAQTVTELAVQSIAESAKSVVDSTEPATTEQAEEVAKIEVVH